MGLAGPLDLTLATLVSIRHFGLGRTILLSFIVIPAYLWSLPPVSCGCFGPMFRRCDSTARYRAAVQSDLKNLASQQEIYFAEHGTYTDDAAELALSPSNGVSVKISATENGWAAFATHGVLEEGQGCALGVGVWPGGLDVPVYPEVPGHLVCDR